jgi:hypothetical protein
MNYSAVEQKARLLQFEIWSQRPARPAQSRALPGPAVCRCPHAGRWHPAPARCNRCGSLGEFTHQRGEFSGMGQRPVQREPCSAAVHFDLHGGRRECLGSGLVLQHGPPQKAFSNPNVAIQDLTPKTKTKSAKECIRLWRRADIGDPTTVSRADRKTVMPLCRVSV